MSSILDEIANYTRPSARDRVLDASAPTEGTGVPKAKVRRSERFLSDLEADGFSMEELSEVLKTSGNQLIVSCAGSGKTTALTLKVCYDFLTKELTEVVDTPSGQTLRVMGKVWVSTFLKTGAQELKNALRDRQRRFGIREIHNAITFSTMHSEFYSLITSLGIKIDIVDARKNKDYLRSVLSGYSIRLNAEELNQFMGALTYTRNRLDASRYDAPIYKDKGLTPTIIDAVISGWAQLRRVNEVMDFEDLQDILYHDLYEKPSEKVIEAVASRYQFIYLDEFQDTSQKQYAIIKAYARDAKKIIAIGDDDQTIYTWRGSSGDIITKEFPADFNPTITKLTKNYRCPSKILDPVVPSISRNVDRYEKEIKSSREGGLLRVGYYRSFEAMSRALSKGIEEDVNDGLSVAVLCRTNSDGVIPALMLDKLGAKYRFSVSGNDMTLDSYIGRQVMSVLSLVNSRGGSKVEKALGQLGYSRNREAKIVAEGCSSDHCTLWNQSREDLKFSAPQMWNHLKVWLDEYDKGTRGIDLLHFLLTYYEKSVYVSDSEYSQKARAVISAILTLLESSEYASVDEFIMDVDDMNERLRARKNYRGDADVHVATVHEFKGKEADSVYIWNDTHGVFPHRKADDVEEERRLHYIACTRAKKISTILANAKKPSPFLNEMDLKGAENFGAVLSATL